MKTLKITSLKKSFCAVLSATILAGGAVSCQEAKPQANAEKPQANAETPDMALQAAVIYGNLEVVKQHIKAGTDLNAKDPMSGATPLLTAATFDEVEIASALIDAGADLSVKNNDGASALHVAAFFGRVEIVQKLLDAGADKTAKNNFGATPRETVIASFDDMKPIYELMKQQLGPLGFELDMEELQKARPVIAMMLK